MTRHSLFTIALVLCLPTAVIVQAQPAFDDGAPAPGNMRFNWIHGSVSAKANTDVRIQVHRYNEHTYILRQNPAIHWEAPFMYLVFGQSRAVLLDTGATLEAEHFPLRDTIDALVARWREANGTPSPQLLVLPLGSDQSQNEGVEQFASRPDTTIYAIGSDQRKELLTAGAIDLGGRALQVQATPGLDDHAIALYDPWTDFLFTGNAFYPGRLVIRDFQAYKASLRDLLAFSSEHPVKWIMGGRIEMSDYPGVDYRLRSNYRPREHVLQLHPELLSDAYEIVRLINDSRDIRIHDHFIVMNRVGRGARDHGYPTYTPESYRQIRLR